MGYWHRGVWAIAVIVCGLNAAPRWRLEYFYDENRTELTITDFKFSSPRRGLAIGYITKNQQSQKPAAVLTADAGAHWSVIRTPVIGRSLFLLSDNAGWMVGSDNHLWFTEEGGRTWRKLAKIPHIRSVCFVTPMHGWAVGEKKTVLETEDGGNKWTPVPDAAKPESTPEYTVYNFIRFYDPQHGLILGRSQVPNRAARLPFWMDPSSRAHRETPGLQIFLQTSDAGKTWTNQTASLFGEVTKGLTGPTGESLVLFEFRGVFSYPSDLLRMGADGKRSVRSLRRKDRAITDIAFAPGGSVLAAGVEPQGKIIGLSDKVKILRTSDLQNWQDEMVDYRAVGSRVMLAVPDDQNAWAATDSGMILRFVAQ